MWEFLIGFVVAIIIALTGVGASVVTAPLLILFLKIPIDIAVSTTLAYSAVVKLIVVPFQVARRQINYRILGIMLLGGVPGVVLGSILFKHVAYPRTKSRAILRTRPHHLLYRRLASLPPLPSLRHEVGKREPRPLARRHHLPHRRGDRLLLRRRRSPRHRSARSASPLSPPPRSSAPTSPSASSSQPSAPASISSAEPTTPRCLLNLSQEASSAAWSEAALPRRSPIAICALRSPSGCSSSGCSSATRQPRSSPSRPAFGTGERVAPWHQLPQHIYTLVAENPGAILLETARCDTANQTSHLFLNPIQTLSSPKSRRPPNPLRRHRSRTSQRPPRRRLPKLRVRLPLRTLRQNPRHSMTKHHLAWFGIYAQPITFNHATGTFTPDPPTPTSTVRNPIHTTLRRKHHPDNLAKRLPRKNPRNKKTHSSRRHLSSQLHRPPHTQYHPRPRSRIRHPLTPTTSPLRSLPQHRRPTHPLALTRTLLQTTTTTKSPHAP